MSPAAADHYNYLIHWLIWLDEGRPTSVRQCCWPHAMDMLLAADPDVQQGRSLSLCGLPGASLIRQQPLLVLAQYWHTTGMIHVDECSPPYMGASTVLLCKAKRQYLLTCKANRYYSVVVAWYLSYIIIYLSKTFKIKWNAKKFDKISFPANTKQLYNIYTMLDQRTTLYKCYTNVLCLLGY